VPTAYIASAQAMHRMSFYLDLTNGQYANQYVGDTWGGACLNCAADPNDSISMAISMYHYAPGGTGWVVVESMGDYDNHGSVCSPYSICHSNMWASNTSWWDTYGEIQDTLISNYCCYYHFTHWTVAFYHNYTHTYNTGN
jgi:hypothetical protein